MLRGDSLNLLGSLVRGLGLTVPHNLDNLLHELEESLLNPFRRRQIMLQVAEAAGL